MRARWLIAIVMLSPAACLFPAVGNLGSDDASSGDAADAATDAPSEASAMDVAPPPPAAIAFVQLNANEYDAGDTALISLVDVKVHDSIIVCAGMDNPSATITVSDSIGSSYAQVYAFASTATGDDATNFVWAAFNVAGGDDTVTVKTPSAHTYFEVYMIEYAGLTSVDVFANAQGTQTGTDQMASGTKTTTFANDLILGYGTEGIGVAGTGFTLRSGFESDVVEDRIVTTAGSYQATATMQSGSGWEMSMVAFKGF